jgi:hypothetical protein
MLEKIVVVRDEADGDKGLLALIRAVFPECEVVTVQQTEARDNKVWFEN